MRWILIDQFISIRPHHTAQAVKNITRAEDYLIEDFPCFPVLPSSLMIEMIAQTGGVLVGASIAFAKEVIIAKVSEARFPQAVSPPASLVIDARLINLEQDGAVIEGAIHQAKTLVAEATIFFGLRDRLIADGDGLVVFPESFMKAYGIREIVRRTT